MQAWIILSDCLKDTWVNEYIFEDRLFFAGLNKDTVLEQLKCIAKDPDRVLINEFELDYDYCNVLLLDKFDSDDCVLEIKLTNYSIKGDRYTYLRFRLILLDMKENSTLQTSIPDEIIQEIRDELKSQIAS